MAEIFHNLDGRITSDGLDLCKNFNLLDILELLESVNILNDLKVYN